MQMVTTQFGDIPEADMRMVETSVDAGNTLQISREWFYIGSDPELVRKASGVPHMRRDAWVTFKCGIAAEAIKGL